MTTIRDKRHWLDKNYRQRITNDEWRKLLLHGEDLLIFRGKIVQLKARSLGACVVEIYKDFLVWKNE